MPSAEVPVRLDYISAIFPAIRDLISDPTVTEIMVVSRQHSDPEEQVLVFFERRGKLYRMTLQGVTPRALHRFCYMVARPLQMDPDEQPLIDARLADGSRVALCVSPATPHPALTIRRFGTRQLTAADLVASGSLPHPVLDHVVQTLQRNGNILVAGGTGSGKTTLLNAFIQLLPADHRLLVVEDTLELKVPHLNVVRLEARALAGAGFKLTARDMVRHALRQRPDHIVVGELRGQEAQDALQALNTGHGGSMTTIHANSAADALMRVASCAMQAPDHPPWDNLCLSVAMAFDLVLHQARLGDGSRGVRQLIAVTGYDRAQATFRTEKLWERDVAASAGAQPPRPVPRAAALAGPAPIVVPSGLARPAPLDPADVTAFPPPPRFGLPSAYLIHRWRRRRVRQVSGPPLLVESPRPDCFVVPAERAGVRLVGSLPPPPGRSPLNRRYLFTQAVPAASGTLFPGPAGGRGRRLRPQMAPDLVVPEETPSGLPMVVGHRELPNRNLRGLFSRWFHAEQSQRAFFLTLLDRSALALPSSDAEADAEVPSAVPVASALPLGGELPADKARVADAGPGPAADPAPTPAADAAARVAEKSAAPAAAPADGAEAPVASAADPPAGKGSAAPPGPEAAPAADSPRRDSSPRPQPRVRRYWRNPVPPPRPGSRRMRVAFDQLAAPVLPAPLPAPPPQAPVEPRVRLVFEQSPGPLVPPRPLRARGAFSQVEPPPLGVPPSVAARRRRLSFTQLVLPAATVPVPPRVEAAPRVRFAYSQSVPRLRAAGRRPPRPAPPRVPSYLTNLAGSNLRDERPLEDAVGPFLSQEPSPDDVKPTDPRYALVAPSIQHAVGLVPPHAPVDRGLEKELLAELQRVGLDVTELRKSLSDDAARAEYAVADYQVYGLFEDVLGDVRRLTREVGADASVSLAALREAGQSVIRLQTFISRHFDTLKSRLSDLDTSFEKADKARAARFDTEVAAVIRRLTDAKGDIENVEAKATALMQKIIAGSSATVDGHFKTLNTNVTTFQTLISRLDTSLGETVRQAQDNILTAQRHFASGVDEANRRFREAQSQFSTGLDQVRLMRQNLDAASQTVTQLVDSVSSHQDRDRFILTVFAVLSLIASGVGAFVALLLWEITAR